MTTEATPGALGLGEGLGPLVEAAGMVNLLNHGAASCVHSEGCHGVTQEHLERFAELVRAAERERLRADLKAMEGFADLWYFVSDEAPLEFEKIVAEYSPSRWLGEAAKLRTAKRGA